MKEIRNITVLGAGSIGTQIGTVAAEAGFKVKIRDIEEKFLERGRKIVDDMYDRRIQRGGLTEKEKKDIMSRLTFLVDLKEAVKDADFVLEAVPEIMDLKRKVFKEVSELCPDETVLATNTSSLSITEIAENARKPERVVERTTSTRRAGLACLKLFEELRQVIPPSR